jgi:hypothetical protein
MKRAMLFSFLNLCRNVAVFWYKAFIQIKWSFGTGLPEMKAAHSASSLKERKLKFKNCDWDWAKA